MDMRRKEMVSICKLTQAQPLRFKLKLLILYLWGKEKINGFALQEMKRTLILIPKLKEYIPDEHVDKYNDEFVFFEKLEGDLKNVTSLTIVNDELINNVFSLWLAMETYCEKSRL